jgi:hypothetical protein
MILSGELAPTYKRNRKTDSSYTNVRMNKNDHQNGRELELGYG